MLHKPDSALVIVGHGSTLNPDSAAPTWEIAEEIQRRGVFGEVHCAFWKEEPSLRQILHSVDRREVYVVPNFISEGYFTQTVIPRELGLDGPVGEVRGHTVKYCQPVGSHPRMTELLLRRAAAVAPGVPPRETSLLIVGHGTGLNDNSAVAAKREVAAIAAKGIYGEVHAAYMEEAPLIAKWDELSTLPNVVVVPFFIADGLHSYEDIPVLLGIAEQSPGAASAGQRAVFARNPYRLRGRTLYYASSIGTEPGFAETVSEQVEAFDAVEPFLDPAALSERFRDTTREFARWLERGGRRIGEIMLAPSGNAWEVRHHADAGRENLELFTDAEDARQIANLDAAGAFRPLKTAPSLRTGWRLVLRDVAGLRQAIEYLYPAMLGAWLAEEAEELSPVTLRETLGRQTGMYRVTQKLSDAQAQEVIAATCHDGACLKTILWRISEDLPIASLPVEKFCPAGGEALPLLCQEGCNLLVAAARKAVKGACE